MGSSSDEEYCIKIAKHCKELGLICQLRVTSAHKGTEGTLQILAEYEGVWVIFCLYAKVSLCSEPEYQAMKVSYSHARALVSFIPWPNFSPEKELLLPIDKRRVDKYQMQSARNQTLLTRAISADMSLCYFRYMPTFHQSIATQYEIIVT